jgi:hypothetical protein
VTLRAASEAVLVIDFRLIRRAVFVSVSSAGTVKSMAKKKRSGTIRIIG